MRSPSLLAPPGAGHRLLGRAGRGAGAPARRQAAAERVLEALEELARATGETFDPSALAQLVVESTCMLLDCDSAGLHLWDAQQEVFHRLADNDRNIVSSRAVITLGQGVSGMAVLHRRPYIVEDYPNWKHAKADVVATGVASCVAVPLLGGSRCVGVLTARSYTPRKWLPYEVELVSLFGTQITPVLALAQLHEESERRRIEAEALAQLVRTGASERDPQVVFSLICEQAARIVGADYAGIALPEPGQDERHVWAAVWGNRLSEWPRFGRGRGRGPLGRTLSERKSIVMQNVGTDGEGPLLHVLEGGKTLLSTPLLVRDGVIGVLLLGWRTPLDVPAHQIGLAEGLAGYAATMVTNVRAYAYEREARYLAEATATSLSQRQEALTRLHEVAVAAGGMLDVSSLGRLVVDTAQELLDADSAGLYWHETETGEFQRIGENDPAHAAGAVPPRARGAVRLAHDLDRPVIVRDYSSWTEAHPPAVARGLKSAVAVPLRLQGRAVGTLVVRSYSQREFSAQQLNILELLAAQVAPALDSARLHAESESRRMAAEQLAELVRQGAVEHDIERAVWLICHRGKSLVGADYAAVVLAGGQQRIWYGLGGDGQQAIGRPTRGRGMGLTSRALAAGRPIVVRFAADCDTSEFHHKEGGRVALVTPLSGRQGVAGALHLGWRTEITPSPAQIRVAEALAGYATVILENSRAHISLAERAASLEASQEWLRTLYESLACGVLVWDSNKRILHANSAAEATLGLSRAEMVGRTSSELWTLLADGGTELNLEHTPTRLDKGLGEAMRKATVELRLGNGEVRWLQMDVVPIQRTDGQANETIASFVDITARKEAERALERQALHDSLTDLPNRALINARLRQAVSEARREGRAVTLLFIDLDHFKDVNDTFGHQSGDALLCQVGARLRGELRASDTLGRLGGDEFAVILPGLSAAQAEAVAQQITASLRSPIYIGHRGISVAASIGMASFPEHGADAQSLTRLADIAMYAAKRSGKRYAVYEPQEELHLMRRFILSTELRRAIGGSELTLHYQPQVSCTTGRCNGVEALLRWLHPDQGPLGPEQFVPLAEETGLIAPLTEWAIETAARQCQQWQNAGLHVSVAVNVSGCNLREPEFAAKVDNAIRRWRLPPRQLRLEVRESSLDVDAADEGIRQLVTLNVPLSIDDFGSGRASLVHVKLWPADEIKIDPSLVAGVGCNASDQLIVRSIIDLGHQLGKRIVAEGVESREAWDWLVAAGCDAAQGQYLAPSMPAAELEAWMRAGAWQRRRG